MEEVVTELKRVEAVVQGALCKTEAVADGAVHAAEGSLHKVEEEAEALVERVEAEGHKMAKRIGKITAEAEDDSPGRATEGQGDGQGRSRKTMNSFVAKAMAAAEGGGHDAKQIDAMLYGLSIEQRMAVKMQMVKAGML